MLLELWHCSELQWVKGCQMLAGSCFASVDHSNEGCFSESVHCTIGSESRRWSLLKKFVRNFVLKTKKPSLQPRLLFHQTELRLRLRRVNLLTKQRMQLSPNKIGVVWTRSPYHVSKRISEEGGTKIVDFSSSLKARVAIIVHVMVARKSQKYRVALERDRVEYRIVVKWTGGSSTTLSVSNKRCKSFTFPKKVKFYHTRGMNCYRQFFWHLLKRQIDL